MRRQWCRMQAVSNHKRRMGCCGCVGWVSHATPRRRTPAAAELLLPPPHHQGCAAAAGTPSLPHPQPQTRPPAGCCSRRTRRCASCRSAAFTACWSLPAGRTRGGEILCAARVRGPGTRLGHSSCWVASCMHTAMGLHTAGWFGCAQSAHPASHMHPSKCFGCQFPLCSGPAVCGGGHAFGAHRIFLPLVSMIHHAFHFLLALPPHTFAAGLPFAVVAIFYSEPDNSQKVQQLIVLACSCLHSHACGQPKGTITLLACSCLHPHDCGQPPAPHALPPWEMLGSGF